MLWRTAIARMGMKMVQAVMEVGVVSMPSGVSCRASGGGTSGGQW